MRWGGLINGRPATVEIPIKPGSVQYHEMFKPIPRLCLICGAEIKPRLYRKEGVIDDD